MYINSHGSFIFEHKVQATPWGLLLIFMLLHLIYFHLNKSNTKMVFKLSNSPAEEEKLQTDIR